MKNRCHQGWGAALGNVGAAFIVKRRTREQWTTETIKGPRRVMRWTKWGPVASFRTRALADQRVTELREAGGLYDYAIFHKGRRIDRTR